MSNRTVLNFSKRSINYYDFEGMFKKPVESRINCYLKDEPMTLNWLKKLNNEDVFYDIGSNIGGFSIIGSILHPKMKIYSFEANLNNYFIQKKTLIMNNLNNILVFNLCLNDKLEENNLLYGQNDLRSCGSSTFGFELKNEMQKSLYSNPHSRIVKNTDKMYGISFDFIIYEMKLPIPTAIKIDIDGNELLVLKGANKLLKEKNLRKIIIEVDFNMVESSKEILDILKKNGFDHIKSDNFGKNMKMMEFERNDKNIKNENNNYKKID
jgi:FkbM family methyltransferase